jgi:Uma2 family endonuclease
MTGSDGGYILEDDLQTVVSPDFGFVPKTRLPRGFPARGFCPIPPDFAVEVISPTDKRADMQQKQKLYTRARVPLVWWVDLERKRVTVHRLSRAPEVVEGDGVLDGGDVLPGFTMELQTIFGD